MADIDDHPSPTEARPVRPWWFWLVSSAGISLFVSGVSVLEMVGRLTSPQLDIFMIVPVGCACFVLLLMLVGVYALLVGMLSRSKRRSHLILVACCIVYIAIAHGASVLGQVWERHILIPVAERGMVVVHAIEAYEQKHGRPPESLTVLVPEFLDRVPETGLLMSPQYIYSAAKLPAQPRWLLSLNTSRGMLNFDSLMYCPDPSYYSRCGYCKPVGEWMYIYE